MYEMEDKMYLKKVNAICSWICTGLLLGHLGSMCYSMLTGWYDYSICKGLAHQTAAVATIHVVISLILVFFYHDGAEFSRYKKQNRRVILQRTSALLIIALLHLHTKAFGFIATGMVLSAANKCFILITEFLFFAAIFSHLGVAFSRSLISMGMIRSDAVQKRVDCLLWIFCGLLLVITMVALAGFVVPWTGFGG